MKLTEFLSLLGYGSKITVTTGGMNEIIIFNTDNFTVPYSVTKGYENATVECFGCYDNRIIVWVKK